MLKVMVSGSFDLLHSGHITFFETAASYGQLYVCIGTDDNILALKNHKTTFQQNERLYMIESIKHVYHACIASGSGHLDFKDDLINIKPDIFIVNEDGDRDDKRKLCEKYGVKYLVLNRTPKKGLTRRSSTALKESDTLPSRLCLAGGWMDQPFINSYEPGSVVTVQINTENHFLDRCGLATSTSKKWAQLTKYNSHIDDCTELAKLLFGYENYPGKKYISGSQDAIGLTHPGINRLDYDGDFWPNHIESCLDEDIYTWLENNLVLVPIGERVDGYDPLVRQNITRTGVQKLSMAGKMCYEAIINKDLDGLGKSLTNTHDAWRELLPLTTSKEIDSLLDSYNKKCTGRSTTGCGGGYIMLATDQVIKEGFKITIKRN